MDFHSLSRRELQTICKRNKIPANMTNLAMADALMALEIVEGIEEFLEASQSETAQSSVDSPVKLEATSPYVPPTGGRTTRRRNAAKEEPETVNPLTRTRRTTRKTAVKDANAIETPGVVGQTTTRKKNLMASACQKMDAKFNECVEEKKKDVSMTPAQLGVTSRRRGGVKEESVVKRVYSTRRSTRLTEKTEMEIGESGLFKNDDENEKINSDVSSDCSDEISGISGVDASTTMETENFEEEDASEVVSAQEQDISISNEKELGSNIEADGFDHEVKESIDVQIEEDDASESVSAQEQDISITNKKELVNNIEADGSDHEEQESRDVQIEEAAIAPVMEAELDNEKSDKIDDAKGENMVMPQNLGNEVQESDGPHDICASEIGISVGNADVQSIDENNIEDAGFEDEAPADLENVILQEDNVAVDELSCDVDIADETEQEMQIHKDMDSEDVSENVNEEVLQINAEMHMNVVEKKCIEPTDLVNLDAKEENEMNLVKDTKLELQQANEEVKSDDVPAADLDLVDHLAKSLHLDEEKHGESETKAVVVQPTCLSPIKSSASEASATKRKITIVAVSDNKENIGSGGKLVLTKERVKIAKNTTAKNVHKLDDLSMRQLTKMLKEKLQITNKSRETENGDEVALPAPARPALKALPENI